MCNVSAIAGVLGAADGKTVVHMLDKMQHRGEETTLISRGQVTIGHNEHRTDAIEHSLQDEGALFLDGRVFENGTAALSPAALLRRLSGGNPESALAGVAGGFSLAALRGGKGVVARDVLGKKPLYLGYDGDKVLFSSEIKSLVGVARDIREFPCGTVSTDGRTFSRFASLEVPSPAVTGPDEAVEIIRRELRAAVARQLPPCGTCGVFLSGGLDSSIIACLARELTSDLKFFSVGVEGSEDVARARELAEHLGVEHHVRTFSLADMEHVLPEAIYHMESYDAPLIRSCIPNYMVAEMASGHVSVVLIGEGGDELFGGYAHLKDVPADRLHEELADLIRALHNTGLQRCDRMPMAWGVEARAPFLDEEFVKAAMSIHPSLKISRGDQVEKWILRKAFEQNLPRSIAWRKKQMFSQGAGSMHMLEKELASRVSDEEVQRESEAVERWRLRNREELHYFRVFRGFFRDIASLPPVGRTKVLYQANPDAAFA